MLQYSALQVPATKLVLGLPWYGYDYPCNAAISGTVADTVADTVQPKRVSPACAVVPPAGTGWNVWATPIKAFFVASQLSSGAPNTSAVALDAATQTKYFAYTCTNATKECPDGRPNDGTKLGVHQVWFDDHETLAAKYSEAAALGALGVGVRPLVTPFNPYIPPLPPPPSPTPIYRP